jgi:hypothetical protein
MSCLLLKQVEASSQIRVVLLQRKLLQSALMRHFFLVPQGWQIPPQLTVEAAAVTAVTAALMEQ